MHGGRLFATVVLAAVGCGKPAPTPPPAPVIQDLVDSWADMGMYLPNAKEIARVRGNLNNATPELAAALTHTNPDVRQRAAFVIAEIGRDAVELGPALFDRLQHEPERIVRIYIVDALAAVEVNNSEVMTWLEGQFESLSSENVPLTPAGGYADVDEKINLAAALFVLSEEGERDQYLDFVTQWLEPPDPEMNTGKAAGYWERRLIAVISLERMYEATEAIPLLESMLSEENAKSWVSVHVPRVLNALKKPDN